MAYINTELEFKTYMFRQLGSKKHKIDIDDDEWSDIYNNNLKYLMDYSSDVVYEDFILVEGITSKSVTLSDNILAVKFVREQGTGVGSDVSYIGASPIYDYFMLGDNDLGSVYSFRDNISEIRKAFTKTVYFTFRPSSKILELGEVLDSGKAYMSVLVTEDITELYDNNFFKKLMERDMWKQWHTNCTKYKNSTIGNGVELNVENMLANFERLTAEIKTSQEEEEYDFLLPCKINQT